jgi:hypothetical protein
MSGIDTGWYRALSNQTHLHDTPAGHALREAADVIDEARDLIRRGLLDEEADRQLILEGVDEILNGGK